MEAVGDRLPAAGQVHHVAGIQHPVAEQVVELQSGAVDRPVVLAVRVKQVIALRRQHGEVLDVTPGELRTAERQRGIVDLFLCTNSSIAC